MTCLSCHRTMLVTDQEYEEYEEEDEKIHCVHCGKE